MKYSFLAGAVIAAIMASCGSKQSNEKASTGATKTLEANASGESSSESVDVSNKAVLLWNSSIISEANSKDGKWVASYQFGNSLTLTGETSENEAEKRTYVEVTGPDGKTGWINQYLIVPAATVGVVTGDISLYKNPDIMSISSDKISPGEIVALSSEEKDGFRQIFGKEKKVKGFINTTTKISSDPVDLKVAVLFSKALNAKTKEEQIAALTAIKDDDSNSSSKILSLVTFKLEDLIGVAPTTEEVETDTEVTQ